MGLISWFITFDQQKRNYGKVMDRGVLVFCDFLRSPTVHDIIIYKTDSLFKVIEK